MPDISQSDRDLMIRTVVGESDDQPAIGQAGVAHVIMNRLKDGRWGDSPAAVVLSRSQFEPWQTRAPELLKIKTDSDRYKKVASVVDDVIAGKIPDPTGGATHFLEPDIVRRRRGGSLPDWASGPGLRIADHVFYKPDDTTGTFGQSTDPMAAIDAAIGAKPAATGAGPSAAPAGSLFRGAGFDVPAAAPVSPAPSGAAPAAAKPGSLFEAAGFKLPTSTPEAPPKPVPGQLGPDAPPGAAGVIETREGGRHYIDAKGNFIAPPAQAIPESSMGQKIADFLGQAQERAKASTRAPELRQGTAEAFNQSAEYARQQAGGVLSGQVGGVPASRVGAALGTGIGAAGAIFSPLTAAIDTLVKKPVTALTGNPEAGERAGALAGFLPAARGGQMAARAANPTNRAVNTLVDAIGPENVPEVAARLRANPNLTLADVSDQVRTLTQGLTADPAQPAASQAVRDAVRQRAAEAPAAVNSAYTKAMGPAPDVMGMLDWLKNRARDAGRKEIEPALKGAKPVDTSPVVKAIDDAVKPGLQAMLDPATKLPLSPLQQELLRLKQQLVTPDGETLTNASRLHDVQSRLGDMAYQLTKSADGKDRLLGSQLRGVNEKLIDQIDEASGGTYRPARQKFKDAKDIHEAWEEGFDVLKNRSGVQGLEDRPEALTKWMKTATPEEKTAKMLGVRADIDQKIRGVRNQVQAGTGITKIEYNREKLQTLFGREEAGRLTRAMDDAADMARTNAKLTEGSKTAETLAGQKALELRKVGGGNPLNYAGPLMAEAGSYLGLGGSYPGLGTAAFMGLKGAHMGFQKVGQLSDRARNTAFARAAMASGQSREGVLSAIGSHPKVLRELQKRGNVPALTASPYVPALF